MKIRITQADDGMYYVEQCGPRKTVYVQKFRCGTLDDALLRVREVMGAGDGWIEWKGGENPAGSRQVTVRLRNGEERTGNAYSFYWGRGFEKDDAPFHWEIVAYRIVQEGGAA